MIKQMKPDRPVIMLLLFMFAVTATGFGLLSPSVFYSRQTTTTHRELIQRFWNRKEHLTYKVSYSFITLGSVIVDIRPDTMYRGKMYREMRVIIKSNPSLPFVGNKEDDFYSLMTRNDTLAYETLFWVNDIDDNVHDKTLYRLHYDERKAYSYIRERSNGPLIAKDTLPLDKPSICGPAFFYDFRLYTQPHDRGKIPIYINQKRELVRLHCDGDTRTAKVQALGGKEIPLIRSSGNAGFEGPFGFKGKFYAWFTDDSLRIPVSAHLKVWIGSVSVHLESYRSEDVGSNEIGK